MVDLERISESIFDLSKIGDVVFIKKAKDGGKSWEYKLYSQGKAAVGALHVIVTLHHCLAPPGSLRHFGYMVHEKIARFA